MKIISTISKILIYGLSGVLTSVTLVLIVQEIFSKFREDRVWHIMLLVSISTFIISGIVGAVIDRPYTTRYKKYIKNGVKTGISVSIISFLVFAIPYSILETDGHKGMDHAEDTLYDLFIISVWVFVPVGAIAGVLAKITDLSIYKKTLTKQINMDR